MAKKTQNASASTVSEEPMVVSAAEESTLGSDHTHDGNGIRLSRHLIRVQGGAYLPAAARVAYFNEKYPGWRLVTELVRADWEKREFAVRAEIYDEQGNLVRTAHSMETGKRVSDPLEKAETSAIARALGYLNIGTFTAIAESERIADAPLELGSRAPIAPPAVQHPGLVRFAKELDVPVEPHDRNEVILRRIYDAVCPRDGEGQPLWSLDDLRSVLRNRQAALKFVEVYKSGEPITPARLREILGGGGS